MNKMYFSPTTNGFYDPTIHAPHQIPSDAVDITRQEHLALLQAQSGGLVIQADQDGRPVAVEPPAPSESVLIKIQIGELEASVTDRRIREALLSADGGWLAGVDEQIAVLRARLAAL